MHESSLAFYKWLNYDKYGFSIQTA